MNDTPRTRHTPAGIPITTFRLRHRSRQQEAGHEREAVCSVGVVMAGDRWQGVLAQLRQGSMVRISGFLSRADNRQGEYRLILHGQHIEMINQELSR